MHLYRPRFHPGEDHAASEPSPRGRAATVVTLSVIVALAAWASLATLYILFRDDALRLMAERQVAITRAYDAQVVQLQAEITRLKSLKLIDQERIERTLSELARRQTVLDTRQSALSTLTSAAKGSAPNAAPETTAAVPRSAPARRDSAPARPTPLSDTILIAPPAERFARLESRPLPPVATRPIDLKHDTAIEVRIANLARELAHMENAQNDALNEIENRYDGSAQRLRKLFAELGLKEPRSAAPPGASVEASAGGPFLPWSRPQDDPFSRQLHRVRAAAAEAQGLKRELAAVPIRRPVADHAEVTSGFGMRIDPFLRQLAHHTGIDFRAETGDPVKAAAAGTVVAAERNGGYGLMVEIDHGNGVTTRYAHLSALLASEGARVRAGAVIGRAGSTGRSTGPHLHYEVRVHGEAVDPQRFLRAGVRLGEID